jgi:hypothetical protein
MLKYIKKDAEEGIKIVHTNEYVDLGDVLASFEDFLRGCGWVFDGHVVIEEDEDEVTKTQTR